MGKKAKSAPKSKPTEKKKAPKASRRMVVLADLSGRMHVINLPHEVYCAKSGECSCEETTQTMPAIGKDGRQGVKRIARRHPLAITILPRGKSEPLHEAVLDCEQVRNAIRARPTQIRVLRP